MKEIKALEKKIRDIQNELMSLGDLHPGSISKQYNICGSENCACKDPVNPKKHGPYYQLSYSIRGRSSSRFISEENLDVIKKQIDNYNRFKMLTMEWKNCAAECAKLKLDLAKTGAKKS